MRSFLNSQPIRDATVTPAPSHKVNSGFEPNSVGNQGERKEETHIVKHKAFMLSIFICVYMILVSSR